MLKKNELLPTSKSYIFKVLEAGEKYYSPQENDKGTISLTPEVAEYITNDLIGKSIIIGHKKITEETIDNSENIVVGRVVRSFVNNEGFKVANGEYVEPDNATYCEGYIDKQTGIDYIEKGYLPSIFYTILEEKVLGKKKVEVLDAEANHLGLVESPKYDTSIYEYYNTDTNKNKQIKLMSNKGTAIANGDYTEDNKVVQDKEMKNEMEGEEMESEVSLEGLYIKDGEKEYSVSEMWEAVKDEIENEMEKKYYDKPDIVINSKTYKIADILNKYKAKQVANSSSASTMEEEEKEEPVKNACDNKKETNEVQNSALVETKEESILQKAVKTISGVFEEKTINYTLGGAYNRKTNKK